MEPSALVSPASYSLKIIGPSQYETPAYATSTPALLGGPGLPAPDAHQRVAVYGMISTLRQAVRGCIACCRETLHIAQRSLRRDRIYALWSSKNYARQAGCAG